MMYFYCTVCEHYHIASPTLPCYMLGRESRRAVLESDPQYVKKLRQKSKRIQKRLQKTLSEFALM